MISTRTAIHESAHALATFLLGNRLHGVICYPEGEGTSRIFSDGEGFTHKCTIRHPNVRATLCILLAGYAAARAAGFSEIAYAADDIKHARKCLSIVGVSSDSLNDEEFFFAHGMNANLFVAHPLRWKAIQVLAEELQKKERMPGKKVVEFINHFAASEFSACEQLEFFFSDDGLSGLQLNLEEHGG
jgi:hypothetical protein